jgi:tetratricopeptide (TPR) repeat protein
MAGLIDQVDIDIVPLMDEPPAPEPAGGVPGYVAALRSLKIWAGNPTFQTLARRSNVPRSTLADALDPGRSTLPRLEVVTAFTTACGLPHDHVLQWHRVWRQIQQSAIPGEPARGGADGLTANDQSGRNFLPGDVADFTGRGEETAALLDVVSSGKLSRVVTISALDGMAGIGKTTLAVHAAHLLSDTHRGGQLFVDLHGHTPGREPLDPSVALHRLLSQIGIDPAGVPHELEDRAALWRAETAGRSAVILLDNAASVQQVRPLLPGGGACTVLITSRRRLVGLEGASILSVKVMTVPDAVELFDRIAGPDRTRGQRDAVVEAVGLCGFLPLAIRIGATRLRHRPAWSVADLVARLRDQQRRLAELSSSHLAVAAAFAISFQQLDERARSMFRLLGLHPGPDVDAMAAAALAGVAVDEAERLLEELLDAHLLDQQAVGRYTFHDLLRAFAAEKVANEETADARTAATRRMIDYYMHSAYGAGALTYASHPTWPRLQLSEPSPAVTPVSLADRQQALSWYGAEYPVLIAVITRAAADGFDSDAWRLAGALVGYLLQAGLWREWLAVNQMSLAASERAGDRRGQAHAHHWLGQLQRSEGHHAPAHEHLRQALETFQALGESALVGQVLLDIALTYGEQARFPEAVEYSRRGLDLFRAIGEPGGEGRALNSLGWYLSMRGDLAQALDACEQALQLARDGGAQHVEAATLVSIGLIHYKLGNYLEALRYYWDALHARRMKGDYFLQADVLTRLGDTHLAMGEPAAARDLWQQALVILDDLAHRDAAGVRERLQGLDSQELTGSRRLERTLVP